MLHVKSMIKAGLHSRLDKAEDSLNELESRAIENSNRHTHKISKNRN